MYLLFIIIIVGAGQQVPKYKLWDINLFLLMDLYRDSIAIVPDRDAVVLLTIRQNIST